MSADYFTQVRTEIATLLPPRVGRVMEIGCGEGVTLEWLKKEFGARRTIGVEIVPAVAQRARQRVDEMHVADISSEAAWVEQRRGSVDLLLLLDVLEHLRDPLATLQRVQHLLAEGGQIIASIPNVRSLKVLLPLVLRGEFRYADSGILDRTHLVFFTRKSIVRLFEDAGLQCLQVRGNGALRMAEAKTWAGRLVAVFNTVTLGAFEGFLANQWLVSARSPPSNTDLR
jgi:2-polyprenyl-3-methyl-5-hydroxy-6-metoxy-1,4-benzoquinol methylase